MSGPAFLWSPSVGLLLYFSLWSPGVGLTFHSILVCRSGPITHNVIVATQTQTPIYGQNEENVLSQPPAARTRSGGKTAKIIPPPPAAPRTIPKLAAPQTPVTEVASQPTVAVTERRKSRPMSASQPLSSIGSRVHRRSGRLAEQVGRKSGSSSSHGNGRRILLLWRTLLATTK
ncbi:hypothetical protein CJ030_MR3G014614 [Morella rubra]|uniref:Uncharacterized protein n=1 Tax=Morella rubra TaxID=262757 RepID=A0A6A1W0X3_9ROSI|nr:hypothetical protein CJ030_MR3G014614 [Morella rubra]